jgi:regulator of replication initiation timing
MNIWRLGEVTLSTKVGMKSSQQARKAMTDDPFPLDTLWPETLRERVHENEIGMMMTANGQKMNAKKQKVVRYKDGQGLFYNEWFHVGLDYGKPTPCFVLCQIANTLVSRWLLSFSDWIAGYSHPPLIPL